MQIIFLSFLLPTVEGLTENIIHCEQNSCSLFMFVTVTWILQVWQLSCLTYSSQVGYIARSKLHTLQPQQLGIRWSSTPNRQKLANPCKRTSAIGVAAALAEPNDLERNRVSSSPSTITSACHFHDRNDCILPTVFDFYFEYSYPSDCNNIVKGKWWYER